VFVVVEPHLNHGIHVDPARYRSVSQLDEHLILPKAAVRSKRKFRATSKHLKLADEGIAKLGRVHLDRENQQGPSIAPTPNGYRIVGDAGLNT
jgi:hypothetical protein